MVPDEKMPLKFDTQQIDVFENLHASLLSITESYSIIYRTI